MDETEFWVLVDRSREAANGDPDRQASELEELLRGRSADDLVAFGRFFDTASTRMYRWDCWEAGILINNGMSDDSFTDFRSWVISRGRAVYEQMVLDADSLAELPEVQDGDRQFEAERFAGVVYHVYVDTYDDEPDFMGDAEPELGPELSDEDIKRVLPRLWALRAA